MDWVSVQDPLAIVAFDEPMDLSAASGIIHTGLQLLDPMGTVECLGAGDSVKRGLDGAVYWAQADELLLVAITLEESKDVPLASLVQDGYQQLLKVAAGRGFGSLVRVWNYLPRINECESGEERYRSFCIGRFAAFDDFGIEEDAYPSACALGTHADTIVIYILASRSPPKHFENPKQVSAYHYPKDYGPRSPSFARATLVTMASGYSRLFVSGTASVIGYETQRPGDLCGQLDVTLQNIDALLAHVRTTYLRRRLDRLEVEVLKVYLRDPADLAVVKAGVKQRFGEVPVVFLAADICRSDLLLEIDGLWCLAS